MGKFPFPKTTEFFSVMLFLLFIMLIGHCYGRKVPPDKKDEWKPCNWKNAFEDSAKTFYTEDNCETYLICYKSKFDPATQLGGNTKLSRRFQMENDNAEVLNCRRGAESLDGWHALRIKKSDSSRANTNIDSEYSGFLEDFALSELELTRNDSVIDCRAKCALTSSSQRIEHQNTSCTEITIPLDAQSFSLNISFHPRVMCKDPAYAMDYSKWSDDPVKVKEKLAHACDQVPMKCLKNNIFELFLCYNTSEENLKIVNKKIADFCRNHVLKNGQNQQNPAVHGVMVGVCIRRTEENELLMETYVQMSFSAESYNLTRRISLNFTTKPQFNYAMKLQRLMLIQFDYNTPPSYFFYGDTNYKDQRSNYKVQHKDQSSLGKPKPIGCFQNSLTRILYAEAYRILDNMSESMPFTQLQMQCNDASQY